jgi:hypothetical protein
MPTRTLNRLLPLLLLALALAVPATAAATTFGAEVGGDFVRQVRGEWSFARTMRSLHALHAAGGRVGRADSDWAVTEPHAPVRGRATYVWGYDDLIATEMASARLRWEPTLAFTPKWAQAHRSDVLQLASGRVIVPLPPARNATFAAYATAFMRRYGAHGSFWATHRSLPSVPVTTVEVWNEPDNIHDWGRDIDLRDYAGMYEAVRTAVHRVNRQTRVVTGGLAWTQSSLPRLLKAFAGKPIDAVAVHPYGATPAQTVALARFAIAELRTYHRATTPVLVNEYGWTSQRGTWGSTRAARVNGYVYRALIGLSKLRLAEVLPFQWTTTPWGLSNGTFARALAQITHRR